VQFDELFRLRLAGEIGRDAILPPFQRAQLLNQGFGCRQYP
jgi:hypothetical protein